MRFRRTVKTLKICGTKTEDKVESVRPSKYHDGRNLAIREQKIIVQESSTRRQPRNCNK